MEKRVRVRTDRLYAAGVFVMILGLTAVIFLVAAYTELDSFLRWFCLIIWVLGIVQYTYWVDCSENEICVTRLGILKRCISAERISSIQLVARRRKARAYPYLVICLDGHRPYNFKNVFVRLFFALWKLSPKVIVVGIQEYQCAGYKEKLTELYGNVTLDESFTKWKKITR